MSLTGQQRRVLAGLRMAARARLLLAHEWGEVGLMAAAAGPGDLELVEEIRARQAGIWRATTDARRSA